MSEKYQLARTEKMSRGGRGKKHGENTTITKTKKILRTEEYGLPN